MSLFRTPSDERRFVQDMARFMAELPPGATKIRCTLRCTICSKRWERKIDLRDRKMPEAFSDLRREGLLHEHLYEHSPLEFGLERLT